MFKKLSFIALAAILAASCSKSSQTLVPVTVHVQDFRITIDTFADTKATPATEYSNLKALTLAFYSGETEVFKSTQFQIPRTRPRSLTCQMS